MANPAPTHTEMIKTAYRANSLNFVNAVYELCQIGHTPAEAQKIAYELIKEKYNGARDHGHTR